MSENVRVKVSSIRPVFIQTVTRSQQWEEARVCVCLVAVDTRTSLYTAIKLASLVTFDKREKVTRMYAHLRDDLTERTHTHGSVELLWSNLSQKSADTVDWNLCENGLYFFVPVMRLPLMYPVLLSVSVYSHSQEKGSQVVCWRREVLIDYEQPGWLTLIKIGHLVLWRKPSALSCWQQVFIFPVFLMCSLRM